MLMAGPQTVNSGLAEVVVLKAEVSDCVNPPASVAIILFRNFFPCRMAAWAK